MKTKINNLKNSYLNYWRKFERDLCMFANKIVFMSLYKTFNDAIEGKCIVPFDITKCNFKIIEDMLYLI